MTEKKKKRYPADRQKLHALLDRREQELLELQEEVEDLRGLVKIRGLSRFENLQAACRRSVIVGHAAAPFKKKPRTGVVRGFHNKITVLRRRSTSCGPCPYART